MSRFAAGITVVSCRIDGVDHAMTANAFTSVSLTPLLVLVCVERDARFHDAISASEHWAVSILPRTAESTARWLATRGRPLEGQLDDVPHRAGEVTGAALIDGALASLECRTDAIHRAGDHDIVVGEVVSVQVAREEDSNDPLIYFRRQYRDI